MNAGMQELKQDVSTLLQEQHQELSDSMAQQMEQSQQRTTSVAEHADESSQLLNKDMDSLQAHHVAESANTTEELRTLRFMEAQAQAWSQNNNTAYVSQLYQLKQELDMTLSSLANVQRLQIMLLNATLMSGQEQRTSEMMSLQHELLTKIDIVNSSLKTARSQLLSVDALIGHEQEEDQVNVSSVLSDELASLRANIQNAMREGKDSLQSQLRSSMSQLRNLVVKARSLSQGAKKVITDSVTAEEEKTKKDAENFDSRAQKLEADIEADRHQQVAGIAALRAGVTAGEQHLNAILADADRNKHALLREMEEDVSQQVIGASTGLWSFLQQTIKNVDDAVQANMNSMHARLPAERKVFDQRLSAVQVALSTARQAQQAHIRAQMLALRALSMQIDSLSDKAAMSMPAVRTKLAQLLARLTALDSQRAADSRAAEKAISETVRSELQQMQTKVRAWKDVRACV